MTAVNFSYIDSALDDMEDGAPPTFWRHFHWGLFDRPDHDDDSPERYFAAAEAMTERLVSVAEIADSDSRILDVGCGFGGTLDYIGGRNRDCRLFGINIDLRQLRWARRVVGANDNIADERISFVTADGCSLPLADNSVDHVLAVECIFHFPSRKQFFREAARVLRPGGTLALSDFLVAPGSLTQVANTMSSFGLGDANWYGRMSKPLSSTSYARIARHSGFAVLVDDDVTTATLPTYPALRRLAREAGTDDGVSTVAGVEQLSLDRHLEYHILAFRRKGLNDGC